MESECSEEELDRLLNQTSQRQKWQRRPKRASDVISKLMARSGYAQQESSGELLETWNQVVGPSTARRTRPGVIRRGVLEVMVENSSVLQELTFRKNEVLQKMKQTASMAKIREIRFRIGAID